MHSYSGKLPPPGFVHDDGVHLTEVFIVKQPGTIWTEPLLRRIALCARRSYRRYGNVPLTDRHDDQSTILLVRTQLSRDALSSEEWLTVRFVHGELLSARDAHRFLMCKYGTTPVVRALAPIFPPKRTFLKRTAFVSRIAGIPSPESKDGKLACTAYAFAHAIQTFFTLADLRNQPVEHLLGIYRDELIEHSLTIERQGRRIPTFYLVDSVVIDRHIVAYEYPTYFFDIRKIEELLRELLRSGAITGEALAPYVGGRTRVHAIETGRILPLDHLKDLGKLFAHRDVAIPGSTLTGSSLRALIDAHVPDGPHLRIILRSTWRHEQPLLTS